jgi:hypothetical protein
MEELKNKNKMSCGYAGSRCVRPQTVMEYELLDSYQFDGLNENQGNKLC